MTDALAHLHAFDITEADITIWAFKKSASPGSHVPVYTGRWVGITPVLDAALKDAIEEARDSITETFEYALLAQNNESSALTITIEETYAGLVIDQAADPTTARKIKSLKDIANAKFYVVKLSSTIGVIYCVKRTDDSWRSKTATKLISMVFKDNELDLELGRRFTVSRYFDFFIVQDTILVTNKLSFESLLSYREAHIEDFASLQAEPEFKAVFADLTDLLTYVGSNKIQLRRASAIRQKAHYKNPDFMDRLRKEASALGFNIKFDADGKIIPTPESCRDIFQALLDHRLDSRLSRALYDVENAEVVSSS